MFQDAHELLKSRQTIFQEREVHAVSYRWNGFVPSLKVYDDGKIEEIDLGLIDFNISQNKYCVGSFEDGYSPCHGSRKVNKFMQCSRCAPSDIPRLECIYEPGDCTDCPGGFCKEEHAVYVAFHSILPKIGMTVKKRLRERLIEQGADAFALLATEKNRKEARQAEKELSDSLKIPQKIGRNTRLKRFAKKVDRSIIERKYRGIRNRVSVGKLKYLKDYPISLPLRAEPRLRATPGIHRGTQKGIKGPFLIYENGGLQALTLSDLPGRKIRIREY